MNKSVEAILRESREKRSKTLEIKKVNNSSDVEMKVVNGDQRKERNFRRRKRINRRFDRGDRLTKNKFKNNRNFIQKRRRKTKINLKNNNTRLYISNLNHDTTNSDIKTLFESIGPLKRCGIHWNELGQSKGSADVEYFQPQHANEAKNKFNSGILRGVPIKIQWFRNKINNKNELDQVINGNLKNKNFRLKRRLGTRRNNK